MARTYSDAAARWAGVGPYYAMFPVSFSNRVVDRFSDPGDFVLDPFAGRGTAVFSAATRGRGAIGIEINPVGYVYAKAKLATADRAQVESRIEEIAAGQGGYSREAKALPLFFHRCYAPAVLKFLLSARAELDWRRRDVDRTLMALVLVYLHGKTGAALSNQMRQTKAMSPQYAVKWWEDREMMPPEVNPVEFLRARLGWRYAKGTPVVGPSRMYLGDSAKRLSGVAQLVAEMKMPRPTLLFTSPPYHGITNYHYDQWLRLWMLGGPPNALLTEAGRGGKFESRVKYKELLLGVFEAAAGTLAKNATVYVRTGARDFTHNTTREVLATVFPKKRMREIRRPLKGASQTRLFGSSNEPRGSRAEVDLILEGP